MRVKEIKKVLDYVMQNNCGNLEGLVMDEMLKKLTKDEQLVVVKSLEKFMEKMDELEEK